jgi:hypothetical protein
VENSRLHFAINFYLYSDLLRCSCRILLQKITFFGNIENVFDYRQTRQESLISGPNNTPQFTEVWAPLDGFVFNFGLKIKL